MPSVKLYTSSTTSTSAIATPTNNPLPTLLHTPSGLAILEIQGTIHAPFPSSDSDSDTTTSPGQLTDIGRLEFPLYDPTAATTAAADEGGKWMKRVYFYVGKHQRLVGEVKKLAKAVAVIRKREAGAATSGGGDDGVRVEEESEQELEIADIIRWKIMFGGRPEPVGVDGGGEDVGEGKGEGE